MALSLLDGIYCLRKLLEEEDAGIQHKCSLFILCCMQCVARSIGSLNPATALSYLGTIQYEIASVLQPSLSALSSNVSSLLVSSSCLRLSELRYKGLLNLAKNPVVSMVQQLTQLHI